MERGRARGRAARPPDRAALEATPAQAPTRWRFWPVLLSAFAAFLAANLALFGLGLTRVIEIGRIAELTPEQIGVLTAVQDLTLAAVLLGLLTWWAKVRPAELGATARLDARTGIAVGAGLWIVSIVVASAEARVIGAHPQSLIVAAEEHRSVLGLVIELAFGSGVVPVVEELLFRAVLFGLFRQRLSFLYAAALSSALFAVVHEVSAWLPVFVLGMGLAYLYERQRSLWTNALAHGTLNALSFLALFFLPGLGG